ncbi:MAG: hypothetical protein HY200_05415 [Nitrospirae bacterium]|nr:hypothetical protein [Nitrospirota bacterium]
MNIEVQSRKAIHISSDILVLGFFDEMVPPRGLAGEMDWLLNNSLSLLIKTRKIAGRFGEVVLVSSDRVKTSKIFWVGLGKKEEYNHARISQFAPDIYRRLQKLEVKEAYLDLWDIDGCQLDFSSALNAFLNGIFESNVGKQAPLDRISVPPSSTVIDRDKSGISGSAGMERGGSGGIERSERRPLSSTVIDRDKSGISGSAGMERGGSGGIERSERRPPDSIDLTIHIRDADRVKDFNRFLKDADFKSKIPAKVKV